MRTRCDRRAVVSTLAGLFMAVSAGAIGQEIWIDQIDPMVRFSDGTRSLLVSQIGYAIPGVRQAFLVAPAVTDIDPAIEFVIEDGAGIPFFQASPVYVGEWQTMHFWSLDLSAIEAAGDYRVCADGLVSHLFPVASVRGLYFDPHVYDMMIGQLRRRIQNDPTGGFIDAGNDIREANSHATQVVGMLDMLDRRGDWIPANEVTEDERLLRHAHTFLASLQEPSGKIAGGFAFGTPITDGHWPNHLRGTYALLRLARYFSAGDPALSAAMLDQAELAIAYMRTEMDIATKRSTFIAERMLVSAEYHLQTGDAPALDDVRVVVGELRLRQLRPTDATANGLYGLFRQYRGGNLGRINAHDFGETTGSYLSPPLWSLIDLAEANPSDPDIDIWRSLVYDYVAGFLEPVAAASPFGLVANGEYDGIRWFSDLFHGMSMTYADVATAMIRYGEFLGRPGLYDLAERQLLWIGGLNTGAGFPTATQPFSSIVEKGYQWLRDGHGTLKDVRGSITNGLSATPQFVKTMPVWEERPEYLCDESWISHTGTWLSATSEILRARLNIDGTLLAVESGSNMRFFWKNVNGAVSYSVYGDIVANGPYLTLVDTATDGAVGVTAPTPGEPMVFFRATATDDITEGPR